MSHEVKSKHENCSSKCASTICKK